MTGVRLVNASSLQSIKLSFQVQPQADPALKPRVVHRGLEGLPDIPDGETNQVLLSFRTVFLHSFLYQVDHLCFVVHGIGAACDIKFRPIAEVLSIIL